MTWAFLAQFKRRDGDQPPKVLVLFAGPLYPDGAVHRLPSPLQPSGQDLIHLSMAPSHAFQVTPAFFPH